MHNAIPSSPIHKHILVVDDNEINRKVAERILLHLGCQISFAEDGYAAIAAVQQQQFDLVLMDCHMPNLDGIAATQAIRAREQSQAQTPIVIIGVSADVAQENRDQCAAVGMNGFMPKPLNLAAVKQLLVPSTRSVHAAQLMTSESSVDIASALPSSSLALLPTELFAHEQFLETKQLMGAGLSRLLHKFGVDAEQQLAAMHAAALAGDAEGLRRCAHKLKGSSASLGAHALAARCAEVERKAIARELEGVMPLTAAAAACYAQSQAAIDAYLAAEDLNKPKA